MTSSNSFRVTQWLHRLIKNSGKIYLLRLLDASTMEHQFYFYSNRSITCLIYDCFSFVSFRFIMDGVEGSGEAKNPQYDYLLFGRILHKHNRLFCYLVYHLYGNIVSFDSFSIINFWASMALNVLCFFQIWMILCIL